MRAVLRSVAMGYLLVCVFLGLAISANTMAQSPKHSPVTLEVSGVQGKITSLSEVNTVLRRVGVHLGVVNDIPSALVPVLRRSEKHDLTQTEKDQISKAFELTIDDVKFQRETLAGRPCNSTNCGQLKTEEVGVPPYPKVYSLGGMTTAERAYWGFKLGRLHVNAAPTIGRPLGQAEHVFTEEVHTLLSGGPNVWYWSLGSGNGVIRLTMGYVTPGEPGWRITFPGSTPHGGMFTKTVTNASASTVCNSYISGPPAWFMSYTLTGVEDPVLGENPWIDFNSNPRAPQPREATAAAAAYASMMERAKAAPQALHASHAAIVV